MKILSNADDAICNSCKSEGQLIVYGSEVSCRNCGCGNILTRTGRLFIPQFKENPDNMFKASPYTPPVKDRRSATRSYPLHKERRKNV